MEENSLLTNETKNYARKLLVVVVVARCKIPEFDCCCLGILNRYSQYPHVPTHLAAAPGRKLLVSYLVGWLAKQLTNGFISLVGWLVGWPKICMH
jgi:hypothetical protein